MYQITEIRAEWSGQTTVHPLGLALVLATGMATLLVPRRYAFWPMIVVACFVSQAQRLVVAGADFDFLRIMVVFGWLRVLSRGELRPMSWHRLDMAVVAWAGGHLLLALIRVGTSTLMNKLGFVFDSVGMYLLFRVLLRDWTDLKQCVLGFALLSIPVAVAFALEHQTSRNMFSLFGGVPEITMQRAGRLRCQGAFSHPILAGLFWASLLPLFAALWWEGGWRRWIASGAIFASGFIVTACASAAPVAAVLFAAIGGVAFLVRHWMHPIRWGLLFTVVALHFVMNAPVWHLISRFDLVGGSSGYHRFQIIDGAIRHADEWWLFGTEKGTAHWGHYTFDVTNYYIVQGLHGGLLLLGAFFAVLGFAFGAVGRIWRRASADRVHVVWGWALGVALFVHATSFVTISYFGQILMVWFLPLAAIGSMTPSGLHQPSRPSRRTRRESAARGSGPLATGSFPLAAPAAGEIR